MPPERRFLIMPVHALQFSRSRFPRFSRPDYCM